VAGFDRPLTGKIVLISSGPFKDKGRTSDGRYVIYRGRDGRFSQKWIEETEVQNLLPKKTGVVDPENWTVFTSF
jgi:hypothetical protein